MASSKLVTTLTKMSSLMIIIIITHKSFSVVIDVRNYLSSIHSKDLVQVNHDAVDFVNELGDVSMMLRLVHNDALHSEITLF